MMKKKFSSVKTPIHVVETKIEVDPEAEKNKELMARLATGVKATVDMKQMKKLTIKNYEKLPEIVKKKQE